MPRHLPEPENHHEQHTDPSLPACQHPGRRRRRRRRATDRLRGSAAPQQARADQVIVVTAATRHVNVTGGSTVRFVVGDRAFTWNFQNGSAHVIPFDLARIAPPGLLDHRVTTYVSDNPLYQNN